MAAVLNAVILGLRGFETATVLAQHHNERLFNLIHRVKTLPFVVQGALAIGPSIISVFELNRRILSFAGLDKRPVGLTHHLVGHAAVLVTLVAVIGIAELTKERVDTFFKPTHRFKETHQMAKVEWGKPQAEQTMRRLYLSEMVASLFLFVSTRSAMWGLSFLMAGASLCLTSRWQWIKLTQTYTLPDGGKFYGAPDGHFGHGVTVTGGAVSAFYPYSHGCSKHVPKKIDDIINHLQNRMGHFVSSLKLSPPIMEFNGSREKGIKFKLSCNPFKLECVKDGCRTTLPQNGIEVMVYSTKEDGTERKILAELVPVGPKIEELTDA